jgi:hypothetical protein
MFTNQNVKNHKKIFLVVYFVMFIGLSPFSHHYWSIILSFLELTYVWAIRKLSNFFITCKTYFWYFGFKVWWKHNIFMLNIIFFLIDGTTDGFRHDQKIRNSLQNFWYWHEKKNKFNQNWYSLTIKKIHLFKINC